MLGTTNLRSLERVGRRLSADGVVLKTMGSALLTSMSPYFPSHRNGFKYEAGIGLQPMQ